MSQPKLSPKLRSLLSRYKRASIDMSWAGARSPTEAREIKENYRKASRNLRKYLEVLELPIARKA